jgi:hypothetical protein
MEVFIFFFFQLFQIIILFQNYGMILVLADGECLKVLLLDALPHRLQNFIWVAKLEFWKTPGGLHSLRVGTCIDLSGKTIVSPEYQTIRKLDNNSLIHVLISCILGALVLILIKGE